MTKKANNPHENHIQSASWKFTDRREYIKAFWDAYKAVNTEEIKVITYYGVGGIGKTSLLKELNRQLGAEDSESISITVDIDDIAHLGFDSALLKIRTELRAKYKVKFSIFDYAYIIYYTKINPNVQLKNESIPFIEESEFLLSVIDELKEIPIVGLLPKLIMVGNKGKKVFDRWITKKKQEELKMIDSLSAKEILECLPRYLAMDIYDYLSETGRKAVVFIDTFEALWISERNKGNLCAKDDWLHKDNGLICNLPGVLWVIGSRERINWAKNDQEWEESIEQHLIGNLAIEDTCEFLKHCGIDDREVCDVIYSKTEGHPFFLDIAVEIYNKISVRREPKAIDFLSIKSPQELTERFVKYLYSSEKDMLIILSNLNHWDYPIFELLEDRFKPGFAHTAFGDLCNFSFIIPQSKLGSYEMHAIMKKCLQDSQDDRLMNELNKFMFDYYRNQLETNMSINNIERILIDFSEAAFHGMKFTKSMEGEAEYSRWFFEQVDYLNYYGKWDFLTAHVRGFIEYIKKNNINPCASKLAEAYNCLGNIYIRQAMYIDADQILNEGLVLATSIFGEWSAEAANCLNSLAALYKEVGRYNDSEVAFKKALHIFRELKEVDELKIALLMNNLAGIYQEQDKLIEAADLYKSALVKHLELNGSENIQASTLMNNLGSVYMKLNRINEAGQLITNSTEITTRLLGKDHPTTNLRKGNLANYLLVVDRLIEAEKLLSEVLEFYNNNMWTNHPAYGYALEHLVLLKGKQEKYNEMLPIYEKVIAIFEATLGKTHPDTEEARIGLVAVYAILGEREKALTLLNSIPKQYRRLINENSSIEEYLNNKSNHKNQERTVGRNELCPCGSGKKYKKCHGSILN